MALWTKPVVYHLQGLVDASMQHSHPEAAFMAVLAWLRFSAARLLTWNRNYNVKPREISAAQEGLTAKLAALYEQRPDMHDQVSMNSCTYAMQPQRA